MKNLIKKSICQLNQSLGRFKEVLFLLGDGRSGTTWVQEVLNFDGRYREMFEPFNGRKQLDLDYDSQYLFPGAGKGTELQEHIESTLRGDFINMHISLTINRLLYDGLLIKDISSHLILDEIFQGRPGVKRVMLLRHPFAVALSKTKKFKWPTKPELLLSDINPNKALFDSYKPLVENTNDAQLSHLLVWCMVHKSAFNSKAIQSFNFVFYEDLVLNPEENFKLVFEGFGQEERYEANREKILQSITRKSRVTSKDNAIRQSRQGKSKWMDEWPKETIDRGVKILESFGLDFLYGEDHFPNINARELKQELNERYQPESGGQDNPGPDAVTGQS